jgi:hypothetical protein
MRFPRPLYDYDADSIIRSGSDPRSSQQGVTVADLSDAEARARALRAETIASLLRRLWAWLDKRAWRAQQRRVDEHLARAQNLPELEDRMRKLERDGLSSI